MLSAGMPGGILFACPSVAANWSAFPSKHTGFEAAHTYLVFGILFLGAGGPATYTFSLPAGTAAAAAASLRSLQCLV